MLHKTYNQRIVFRVLFLAFALMLGTLGTFYRDYAAAASESSAPSAAVTGTNQNKADTSTASNKDKEQAIETASVEPATVKYETTAYYLNVRAKATSKSKILNVVKKGTILEVLERTDNGWLKLAGGGYVHGGYAAPANQKTTASKPVNKPVIKPETKPVIKPEIKTATAVQTGKPALLAKPDKPTSAVKSASGLTEQHIAKMFKGTGLAGHGLEEAVLDVELKYGINAYFTIAVMKLESGNGNSRLAKNKNNLFGLNSRDGSGYLSFKSKTECVEKFGQLISKSYIGKGFTTVEKISRKYCPANPKWSGLVKNIMNRDYRFV